MARKKKEETQDESLEAGFVEIKDGYHSITLSNRTIHCPNGVAYVNAEEKARIEAMGLIK